MSLVLYNSIESTCGAKVRLVLAEKQLQWTETPVNLRKGEQFTHAYLRLNPKAVVPTLVHDGRALRESTIINEYLDDVFPSPSLRPVDPMASAQMRVLVKTFDDEVHPAIGILTYAMVLRHQMDASKTPEELAAHFARVVDPKRRERQQGTHQEGLRAPPAKQAVVALTQVVAQMAERLEHGPWLGGEAYSLADACAAPYMVRMAALGLDRLWSSEAKFAAWFANVTTRDNCQALPHIWGPPDFTEMVAGYVQTEAAELTVLLATIET